jgi:acyl-coenzyme A thioesterase PaaI-like protein
VSTDAALTEAGFGVFAEAGGPAPDYERLRVIASGIVPFAIHAGLEITEIGPERAVVAVPAGRERTNQMGTVHAGAQFLAADVAGACAFVGAMAPRIGAVNWLVVRDAWSTFRKPASGRVLAVATVEERPVRALLAGAATGAGRRFELDGKATIQDEAGAPLAVFRFSYVGELA